MLYLELIFEYAQDLKFLCLFVLHLILRKTMFFLTELLWQFYKKKSIDHTHVGVNLESLLCSSNVLVYLHANIITVLIITAL